MHYPYNAQSFLPLPPISAQGKPLEKLELIEKVQGDRDWLATVVAEPDADSAHAGRAPLRAIAKRLELRGGYHSYLDEDLEGRPVLRVHHLGPQTGIGQGFTELGLVGGMAHATNLTRHQVQRGAAFVKEHVDTPAKFLAANYLIGDILSFLSGFNSLRQEAPASHGSQGGGAADALMSVQGVMSYLQSLVLMRYADRGHARHFETLRTRMEEALQQGEDPYAAMVTTPPSGTPEAGMWGKVEQFLTRHPVKSGAGFWILGQLALFVSGGLRLQQTRDSANPVGANDMRGAAISTAAWLMLMVDEQQAEQPTPWKQNPLKRAWEQFRASPNTYAGITMLGSSLYRLRGGMEKDNPFQILSELANLTGDAAMFVIHTPEYGASARADTEEVAKTAARFMERSPLVLGPDYESAFVHKLAGYLAESANRSEQAQTNTDAPRTPAQQAEAVNARAQPLARAIFMELATQPQPLEAVAARIAAVTHHFPLTRRPEAQAALVETVAALPGVYVAPETLQARVASHQQQLQPLETAPETAPNMSDVSGALADLTFALPAFNAGDNAMKLYDTLAPLTQATVSKPMIYERALMAQAGRDLGMEARARPSALGGVPGHQVG